MTAAPRPSAASPAPSQGVWYLGPLPLRGVRAVHHPRHRRWRSGSASDAGSPAAARPGEVSDLALWAVPFGLVGGRLYHVITD